MNQRLKLSALVALLSVLAGAAIIQFGFRADPSVLGSSQDRAGARVVGGCDGPCTPSGFMDLDGRSDLVIENVHISNPNGRCLSIDGASNITIRNSVIGPCGTNTGVQDGYETGLVTVIGSNNITFEANLVEDIGSVSTILLRNNAFWIRNSPDVTFVDNTIRDVHSDISRKNGNEGNRAIAVSSGSPRFVVTHNTFQNAGRNAVQYARNFGVSGVEISYNVIEGNGPWDSEYEDMINLYASTGRPGDPIKVIGNYGRFGGPSNSGTGIIVGDGNPSEGTNAHVLIAENVFVDPGHVGIGVAGGSDIAVRDNIVFANSYPTELQTAVGMYVNHFDYGPTCDRISITGNRVYFSNSKLGSGTNHIWNPGTCAGASFSGNVFGDTSLSAAVWNPGTPASRSQTQQTQDDSVAQPPQTEAPSQSEFGAPAPQRSASTTSPVQTAPPQTDAVVAPTTRPSTPSTPSTSAPATSAVPTSAPSASLPSTTAPASSTAPTSSVAPESSTSVPANPSSTTPDTTEDTPTSSPVDFLGADRTSAGEEDVVADSDDAQPGTVTESEPGRDVDIEESYRRADSGAPTGEGSAASLTEPAIDAEQLGAPAQLPLAPIGESPTSRSNGLAIATVTVLSLLCLILLQRSMSRQRPSELDR